ncbi:hypothetical protein GCM10023335_78750 [Streptomyces siamensis]|uniref:Uncharacterized protein n=1 Tax=Streptomyces siamensis TaxID=1274986 RepID=A0ABP9JJV6_9ACTN
MDEVWRTAHKGATVHARAGTAGHGAAANGAAPPDGYALTGTPAEALRQRSRSAP